MNNIIKLSDITKRPTLTMDKATMMTCKDIFNSPEKSRLRRRIEYLKKYYKQKMDILQRNVRRKDTKIATLTQMLNKLEEKKLLTNGQSNILQTFVESTSDMLCKQGGKKKCVPNKYDNNLRSFALTLHFYSPRAYEYVRSKFKFSLPHVKTISKWYCNIEGNPGISSEALNNIKERVNASEYPLLGALMFDEMAIRQHVEYDGTKFSGYTDMGQNIACDGCTIATEALVFMIVCINGAWKLPIAYYLINKITAEEKSNLVLQCISAVYSTGMRVVSVTCDGMMTNQSTLKLLGCKFKNITSLQTWFPHPDTNDKVVVFLDPCHMLKLVRNVMGDLKLLVDGKNQYIRWSDIVHLHEFQQRENMHLANKLRSVHIDYFNQKMKVRFAAQIFSTSVANAIAFCQNTLKLKEFQYCDGTIQFLRTFNDLFDILNSRNLKQHGFKQPINEHNIELIRKKLAAIKMYIVSLKTTDPTKINNGQLVIESRRKTGFLGFLVCIYSAITLYEEVCEKQKLLKYVPFYKVSQDHAELLFGCIRRQGGNNNNPTVRQFKAVIKKLLIHSEIRDIYTGNCIPLEYISILNVSSATKTCISEDVINMTTRLSRMINDTNVDNVTNETIDLSHVISDHNYLPDVRDISEFSGNVIEYIAGYVVKHLRNTLHCDECLDALIDKDPNNNNLIRIKNKGGLIQPAKDVVTICIKCEKSIRHALHINNNALSNKLLDLYLTNDILESLLNVNVFEILKEHSHDQAPLDNHIIHLIRTIIQKYVKIRLHYIALNSTNKRLSKRHLLNKIVLFKGM